MLGQIEVKISVEFSDSTGFILPVLVAVADLYVTSIGAKGVSYVVLSLCERKTRMPGAAKYVPLR